MAAQINSALLRLQQVSVLYGNTEAVQDVSGDFYQGEMTAVIGPNGSGKSSLMKAMLGLIPSKGQIYFRDKPVKNHLEKIAYVPQRAEVDWFFPASVQEVVEMGRYEPGKFKFRLNAEDKSVVADALDKTGLTAFAGRQIGALSGGQQQRVFIARALARQAELFLMDEPFSGVDMASEENILNILLQLRDAGKTLIVIHHDLNTVSKYFQRVWLMNKRLVKSGTAREVLSLESLRAVYGSGFISGFIGEMSGGETEDGR